VTRPRYDGRPVGPEVVLAVAAFVFLFAVSWATFSILLGLVGLDPVTAVSAAATALGNVGPGLGDIVGPAGNFRPLGDAAKWLLILAMLLGRLEFFTLLVLLHPGFWRW
jgi:trk system potassium uptake protein TrkH